jgi:hypothetical protein
MQTINEPFHALHRRIKSRQFEPGLSVAIYVYFEKQ